MKITRIFSGKDGESHFEDVEIAVMKPEEPDRRSESVKATGLIFREADAGYGVDWHNAPCRQFVITLTGHWEIVIGDGTIHRFGPGDILLAEDITGHGHISRAVNNEPRTSIFVTLD